MLSCCLWKRKSQPRRMLRVGADTTVEERTLVIIRGDAIAKGEVGKILSHFEHNKLKIVGMKTIAFDENLVAAFYGEHVNSEFYPKLQKYLIHAYHLAFVFQGVDAIALCLALKGNDPKRDKDNTLRKQFGIDKTLSTIHSSDNKANAEREIALCFRNEEIHIKAPEFKDYLEISNMTIPYSPVQSDKQIKSIDNNFNIFSHTAQSNDEKNEDKHKRSTITL